MWLLWSVLFLAGTAGARPADPPRQCSIGNVKLPADIFECYAGWQCYEQTYVAGKPLNVHVCAVTSGDDEYTVPCFKAGPKMMTFNLKSEETVAEILDRSGSRELNDEMIRCYLSVVNACEIDADGWLTQGWGCRIFLPNSTANCCLEGQSKFHIAMLSISLIVGIPVAIILSWCTWITRSGALPHCRNLIVALVFRTLFTLLIETEVTSVVVDNPEEPLVNWSGCEALATFETFLLNVVVAFWLVLAFYLLEYSNSSFEREPDIRRGIYIVFGLALALPIVWVIIMAAGDYGNCWLVRTPVQWVNDSLRIAYIILQMIIMSIVVYRVLDHFRRPRNEQALLHGRISIYTLALAPLFLLQFSLSASHPVHPEGEDAHVYTEYFFDGLQCAIASLPYLFLPEVVRFILDVLHLRRKNCHKVFETLPIPDPEMKLPDGHPSPSMQQLASGNDDFRLQTDVTYTSVLSPERFEKMINLYNRLNVIQKQQKAEDVPRNDPDNSSIRSVYYEVDNESVHTVYSDVIQSPVPEKEPKKEPWPNSHYTSKYLVEGSESSGSEESESTSKTGSCDSEATEIPSKSEALTLPEEAWTGKETIRAWLSACRGEFREPTAPEKAAPEVTLHRSLSANIVRTAEATGTVKVNIPQLKKPAPTRKKSAPPALAPKVEEEPKQPDNLPSIYDDLKNYPTRPKPTTPKVKKPDYSPDWANFRARLLDKRRTVRSTEALDVPEEPSTQIDALLSPRYDVGGLNSGTLKSSRFSRFATENLDKVGGEPERDDSIKRRKANGEGEREDDSVKRKVEDWEPQQAFFIAGQ